MPTLTEIPFLIVPQDLISSLRIDRNSQDAADFLCILDAAKQIAKPKAMFKTCYIEKRTENTVTISGATFTSPALRLNLENVERVFPFVATCGTEFDTISIPPGDMLQQYWLDELKAAALEAARAHLFSYIKEHYALTGVTSMSPGSGDLEVWPIEQQRLLFSLLNNASAATGVRLTPECLMIPNKSVSGIIFPSEVTFKTCRLCRRPKCVGRKAPYDKALFDQIHSSVNQSGGTNLTET